MGVQQKVERGVSTIFLVYVLLYSFFAIESWSILRTYFSTLGTFPKHIFLAIGLTLPCLFINAFFSFKKYRFTITVQDGLFFLFVLYVIFNLTYVLNIPIALEGITFWVLIFITYFSFKNLFTFQEDLTNQVLKIGLAILGMYFISDYFISNFNELLQITNSSYKYQDIVRFLPSLVGTKNVTAMFLFAVFILHYILPDRNQKLKLIHIAFQIMAILSLILIGSRNIYIALVVFFVTEKLLKKDYSVTMSRKQKLLTLSIIVLVIILSCCTNFLSHLFVDTFKFRLKMWQISLGWIIESPLTGIGVYHFNIIKPLYELDYHGHPHNDHVRTILELGMIGFLIFSSIWISQIFRAIRKINFNNKYSVRIIGALIAFQSVSLFDGLHYKVFIMIIVIIVWAKIDVESERLNESIRFSRALNFLSPYIKFSIFLFGVSLITYQLTFIQNTILLKNAKDNIKSKNFTSAMEELLSINQSIFYDGVKNPIEAKVAHVAYRQGEETNAFDHHEKTLTRFPFHKQTIKEIAEYHLKRNNTKLADKYLKILLSIDYSDKFALKNISNSGIKSNKKKLKKTIMKVRGEQKKAYFNKD